MADNSTLKDSTLVEGSVSKAGIERKKKKATQFLEPKMNEPGYVNGHIHPYRGRNMQSFCREHKDKLLIPE